jgi:hypothetical protein
MKAIYIEAESLEVTYGSQLNVGGRYIRVELDMNETQQRAAILRLLGQYKSEQAAFDMLRSEFPEWFGAVA